MTDREKLVELIEATTYEALGGNLVVKGFATAKEFADHLIASGVTVQKWRDAKTDPPPIGKEVVLLFSDESSAIGWLEDIEEDGEPVWNVCVEKGWYTTSTCCPEKWQPRPALPPKEE